MLVSNEVQNHVVGQRDSSLPPFAQMRNDSFLAQKSAGYRKNACSRNGLSHRTQMMRIGFKERARTDLSPSHLRAERISALPIPTLEQINTEESDSTAAQPLEAQRRIARNKDLISIMLDKTGVFTKVPTRTPPVPTISSDGDVIEVDTALLKKIASMQAQRFQQHAGKHFWSLPILQNPVPSMSAVVLAASQTSSGKRTAEDKDLLSNIIDVGTGWWKRNIAPSKDPEKREIQKQQFRKDKDATVRKVVREIVDAIYDKTKDEMMDALKEDNQAGQ